MSRESNIDKQNMHDFWNAASCGESLLLNGETEDSYAAQLQERYRLEPYILNFADFNAVRNLEVLKVGIGLGADHQKFAESGANLTGVDLTQRAVNHSKKRFALLNL